MNLTLRHLRVFATVAQLNSFAEAAQHLHLTSPALSQIVKDLEEQTGFKVFDRTTRSVELTQAGRTFLPQVQRLLAEHQNVTQVVSSIRAKKSGIVRIAATQLISCTILPPALTKFRSIEPEIEVIPVDSVFDRWQELIFRAEADIGIGPERAFGEELRTTYLFSSPLNVVCSRNHRFNGKEAISWKELQEEKIIFVGKGAAPLMARDAQYQVNFEPVYEVGHFTTALALAAENAGIVVSSSYGRKLLLPYDLVMIPVTEPTAARKIIAYTNPRFELSPAAERILSYLSTCFVEPHSNL